MAQGRYSRLLRSGVILLAIGLSVVALQQVGLTRALDNELTDLRFQATNRLPTGEIVLVDIDARSLAETGVWPWPRNLHGELVLAAAEAGAARVAFDVDFSAFSTPEADTAFAAALSRTGIETVLAAFVQESAAGNELMLPSLPISLLLQHAWPAMVNVPLDPDGLVRRAPFPVRIGAETISAMPSILAGRDGSDGLFGIDYGIDASRLQRVSYVDVLNQRLQPGALAGKTLIVGATALELQDRFSVPIHGVVSGSTVLALATESLLQGRALAFLDMPAILVIVLALVALLLCALVPTRRVLIVLGGLAITAEAVALHLQATHAVVVGTALLQATLAGFALFAVMREFDMRRLLLWAARTEVKNGRSVLERVIEDGFDGVVIFDDQDRIVRMNEMACELLGCSPGTKLAGLPPFIVERLPLVREAFRKDAPVPKDGCLETLVPEDEAPRILEYTLAPFWMEKIAALDDAVSEDAVYVCLRVRDVTERELAQEKMRFMALHDGLTGLDNRHSLEEQLDAALKQRAPGTGLGILSFDLDQFKAVNDVLGHSVGDKVLIEMARRAGRVIAPPAVLARTGGDEFMALLGAETAEAALADAEALVASLGEIFHEAGHRIAVAASVGVCWWSSEGGTASAMMRQADVALDRAKRAGSGSVVLFEPAMEEDRLARLELEADLNRAFENDEFQVFYQPQVDLVSGEMVGAEALLRWQHPTRGFVSPAVFIPVAEETGLIHRLGAWVLTTACREAMRWPSTMRIAVNVSAVQFLTGDLVAAVGDALEASRLPAERLELEITESAFVEDSKGIGEIFDRLLALGVGFALDDFGTGYSSLGYLHRFPVSKIKIDRSFVSNVPMDGQAMAILRSIRALAEGLGIRTIAEGIETPEQAETLRMMGCQHGQGYLFGKPVDAVAMQSRLRADSRQQRVIVA
ncbi:EAL domain-containing protein [Aurantimonas sp. HBX-1]|uniref:EAL domain-containing protein n=1 Tax=Aurantimonas sp. HBX-1 TaxID=2906072 RepID=UPI001F352C25|nr:EAL domain-containing protein [Aurantimonas sp. HBX-1]UIJ71760.1 EAL domain-containing protein [Aurantimonas sp. HBX-1]